MKEGKGFLVQLLKKMTPGMNRDSEAIWEYAEPGLEEFKSSSLLMQRLGENGFEILNPVASMRTAFVASWGLKGPTIGLLAEYDALETCGPPIGKPGHGCGHNLIGTAVAYAAIALKKTLQEYGLKGKIKVFGCPAEEKLLGKVYMARDGIFDDLDAVITWHPHILTCATTAGRNGLDAFSFQFLGKSAHAAFDPWNGRSALHAVELMNHAVNLMREHVPESVRIHYVITQGGGQPNVVPPAARSWYFIRAEKRRGRDGVEEISKRVRRCAKAAALATETKVRVIHLTGVYETLMNFKGAELVQRNVEMIGAPRFTDDERKYVREIGLQGDFNELVAPMQTERWRATNDYGTVSWLAPLLHFVTTCCASDTPGHSYLGALQYKASIGQKGMMTAAKVMGCTILDLLTTPPELAKIRDEYKKKREGFVFNPIIRKKQKPHPGDGY